MKILILLIALISLSTHGQNYNDEFNKEKWLAYSENNKPTSLIDTTYKNKLSIKVDSKAQAIVWKKNVNFKNFTMDLDIAGAVMSGIGFRVADDQNYQFIYFRPGYGGTQEAIQYIPIYNGALSWVFYNYPEYETTADIKSLEWFHATIEVNEDRLKVFVNNSKNPQLDITLLPTKNDSGSILLRSLFGESYFSNITIKELSKPLVEWEISEQLSKNESYSYEEIKNVKTWRKINDTKSDYVNLCRYFEHPNGTVLAKKNIHSEKKQEKILSFDYIGKLQILLNGKEVFNYAKYKLERVFKDTYKLVLNLEKGKNELVFITEGDAFIFGDGFNAMGRKQHQNWGFIAHLADKR